MAKAVDVEPDALRLAEIGDGFQRIDGPGAAGSGVGAHRDGMESRGPVFGHGASQRFHVQAETFVDGQQPHVLLLYAGDPGGADLGTVALVAHVDRGALGVAGGFPGRDEGVHAGRRAPARQKPSGALRVANPTLQPVDDHQLDSARTAGHQPGALVEVVPGGHEVGQHTWPGRRRRDECETTRVVQACREREHLACDPPHHLRRRPAVLGRILLQLGVERLLEVAHAPTPTKQYLQRLQRVRSKSLNRREAAG